MDHDKLLEDIIAEKDPERARILVELYKLRLDESARADQARLEADAQRRKFWSNPILISLTGGLITVFVGIWTSFIQHQNNIELERERAIHQMVRDAIGTDPVTTEGNLRFLNQAGLLGAFGERIALAANTYGPRRSNPAAPIDAAVEPAELVLQVGSFSLRQNAERWQATHLADQPSFLLKRGDLYAVLIWIDSYQAGQDLIEVLPEEIRAQQPFIRRIADMCDEIGPLTGADAAAGVRACLMTEPG